MIKLVFEGLCKGCPYALINIYQDDDEEYFVRCEHEDSCRRAETNAKETQRDDR